MSSDTAQVLTDAATTLAAHLYQYGTWELDPDGLPRPSWVQDVGLDDPDLAQLVCLLLNLGPDLIGILHDAANAARCGRPVTWGALPVARRVLAVYNPDVT